MLEQPPNHEQTEHSIMEIMRAIIQEKLCPQLLQFRKDNFERVSRELASYEQNLRQYMEGYQESKIGDKNFFRSIYQLEIDRLGYLLKSYLRVRIAKIQKYALFIIKHPEIVKLLTPAEEELAKGYAKLRFEQYDHFVLRELHKDFRGLDGVENFFGKSLDSKGNNESKQARIELVSPNHQLYRFLHVMTNNKALRYNQDIPVSNVRREDRPLIEQGDFIFAPYSQLEILHNHHEGELI